MPDNWRIERFVLINVGYHIRAPLTAQQERIRQKKTGEKLLKLPFLTFRLPLIKIDFFVCLFLFQLVIVRIRVRVRVS